MTGNERAMRVMTGNEKVWVEVCVMTGNDGQVWVMTGNDSDRTHKGILEQ